MIWNGEGTASLELAMDGQRYVVIYRTINDKGIVVKADTIGYCLAALADITNDEYIYLGDLDGDAELLRVAKLHDVNISVYNLPLDPHNVFNEQEAAERYDNTR